MLPGDLNDGLYLLICGGLWGIILLLFMPFISLYCSEVSAFSSFFFFLLSCPCFLISLKNTLHLNSRLRNPKYLNNVLGFRGVECTYILLSLLVCLKISNDSNKWLLGALGCQSSPFRKGHGGENKVVEDVFSMLCCRRTW